MSATSPRHETSPYHYSVLSSVEAQYFAAFALPQHRPLFSGISVSREAPLVAIGAHALHLPFGLALARLDESRERAELLSIFVKEKHRRKGIAGEMLRQLASELLLRGCRELTVHFERNRPYSEAVESLLASAGFDPPRVYAVACRCLFDRMREAEWLKRESRLPSAFEIFPWSELTAADRESILERQRRFPWYPEDLSPFAEGEPPEPLTSLGLRLRGEVVGWQINHRIAADTIQYAITFVRRDLQELGLGVALMVASSRIHVELPDKSVNKAFFRIPLAMTGMMGYLERRLRPYVDETSECVRSVKLLTTRAERARPGGSGGASREGGEHRVSPAVRTKRRPRGASAPKRSASNRE